MRGNLGGFVGNWCRFGKIRPLIAVARARYTRKNSLISTMNRPQAGSLSRIRWLLPSNSTKCAPGMPVAIGAFLERHRGVIAAMEDEGRP